MAPLGGAFFVGLVAVGTQQLEPRVSDAIDTQRRTACANRLWM